MGDSKRRARGRSRPPKRGWLGRLLRLGVIASVLGMGALVVGGAVGAVLYQQHVVEAPGAHLERSNIRAIIAQESPVYYRDGETRIGVFFEDEHRQYVPWDALPPAYVQALVAAEDGTFWRHAGISPKHLLRAMVANLEAGRVVAGGSTLTQQTAKNLYYRPDRSFKSKTTELVNALRLEAHYTKPEIFSFYVNQFHVSGNGRGLGIAARHFFDKEVEALTTLESAFLAGMVKAPSYYDPWRGSAELRARSLERAHDRTRYVLGRIVAEDPENLAAGPVPGAPELSGAERLRRSRALQAEAAELLETDFVLPFKRGVFRYDSSAVLDEVARRLQGPPFREVLSQAGISDPATAGLEVVTTLDPAIQREAVYGLWHHLTEVGAMLEARGAEDFRRADGRGPRWSPDAEPRRHEFRLAEVQEVLDPTGRAHFMVDLGGHPCIVDRDAVIRGAVWGYRGARGDRHARIPTAEVDAFVDALPVGSVVWVSVRREAAQGPAVCDLELRPDLQGAAVVIEEGELRAMVGGNDNRNFNRSTALRQMGSTWKTVLYHAALKLGWSPTDTLDNDRHVFPFSTTFYYPRANHTPQPEVSLAWAGVHSENLASVWLLYHLTDHLNGEQVRALAESLDLARRPEESSSDYRARIQAAGVLPTPRRVEEGFFLQARQEVASGLALAGHPDDALALKSLLYGWGHEAERARVRREPASQRGWKLRALDNSWVHLRELREPCADQHARLARAVGEGRIPDRSEVSDLSLLVNGERVEVACGAMPSGYVAPEEALADWLEGEGAAKGPRDRGRSRPRVERWLTDLGILEDRSEPPLDIAPPGDMRIDDRLHLATLEAIAASIQRRRLARSAAGTHAPGLYDPEVLYWHQDFRVLLGMRYVNAIAAQYGVRTELEAVLSMPLGATEVTLEEAVSAYLGISTGQGWDFPGEARAAGEWRSRPVSAPDTPTLLIAEIRDVDGNVLYRARPEAREVAPREVADMTADIQRNTVRHGTARRASGLLRVEGAHVPLGGKTGTTNDFRNAAFLGFVPGAVGPGYAVSEGFAVGVYVGYDDNTPMSRRGIRLGGSNGALPAWMTIAEGIEAAGFLGTPRGSTEEGWWPLLASRELVPVAVESRTGLPVADGDADATVLGPRPVPDRVASLDFEVDPRARPPRLAPRTEDFEQIEERRRQRREQSLRRPSVWDAP